MELKAPMEANGMLYALQFGVHYADMHNLAMKSGLLEQTLAHVYRFNKQCKVSVQDKLDTKLFYYISMVGQNLL